MHGIHCKGVTLALGDQPVGECSRDTSRNALESECMNPLFVQVRLKLVSAFPGEFPRATSTLASGWSSVLLITTARPFSESELCARQPLTGVYSFLKLLTSHCCAC